MQYKHSIPPIGDNTLPIAFIILCAFFLFSTKLNAQYNVYAYVEKDKAALEGIIVEKYYTATASDVKDTMGGKLAEGSVTYRIFVDMKPGYKLQSVYGTTSHPLFFESSTLFYNNVKYGSETSDYINDKIIDLHNTALDSWISMGAGTKFHNAVLKSEDNDSSIIKSKAELAKVDGLKWGDIFATAYIGIDIKFFVDSVNAKRFSTNNGGWANYAGAQGPTPENRVLIAQLTTNGILKFEFNVQIGTPEGNAIQFVAKRARDREVVNKQLSYKSNK